MSEELVEALKRELFERNVDDLMKINGTPPELRESAIKDWMIDIEDFDFDARTAIGVVIEAAAGVPAQVMEDEGVRTKDDEVQLPDDFWVETLLTQCEDRIRMLNPDHARPKGSQPLNKSPDSPLPE